MKPHMITIIQCSQSEAPTPEFLAKRAFCERLCREWEALDDRAFYPFEADFAAYRAAFPSESVVFDLSDALYTHSEGTAYQAAVQAWVEEGRAYDADMNV